jgi:hypothetical protein
MPEGELLKLSCFSSVETVSKECQTLLYSYVVRDFMLLILGDLGGFQNGPAPFFSRLCGVDSDGIYMRKFMLTKGRLPNSTPYFAYCLSSEDSDDVHIVWTVSMSDEEYQRR